MIFQKTKIFFLMLFSALSVNAQNLMASSTPIDIKTRRIDSMLLKPLKEDKTNEFVSSLYNVWQNDRLHLICEIPEKYRIDLRGFTMPTNHTMITSPYGQRWGRLHKGIDIKVYIGDTICAAFSGKIRVVKYDPNGYGNYVVIRHYNGLETVYGHLSKQLVKPNEYVESGQPIGLGGNTGRSTGSHLHFETRLCGMSINPALMFDFKMQDVTDDFYDFVKIRNTVAIPRKQFVEKRRGK